MHAATRNTYSTAVITVFKNSHSI